MLFSDLLRQIDSRWRIAFVRFVETGEASERFLHYLDSSQRCQRALRRLLAAQVGAIQPYMTANLESPAAKTRNGPVRTSPSSPRPSSITRKRRTIGQR
jgi:hypothetical protein